MYTEGGEYLFSCSLALDNESFLANGKWRADSGLDKIVQNGKLHSDLKCETSTKGNKCALCCPETERNSNL